MVRPLTRGELSSPAEFERIMRWGPRHDRNDELEPEAGVGGSEASRFETGMPVSRADIKGSAGMFRIPLFSSP